MEIGSRLRQVRKTLGLTQAEFAALAGVKANAIVMYEAGRRTPRSTFLAHLSDHGIDVNYVLYGASETRYAERLTDDEESFIRSLRSMHPDAATAIVLAVTAMSAVRNQQDANRMEGDRSELKAR
jgi:transcriptional regulator with XRE-family HTH domain